MTETFLSDEKPPSRLGERDSPETDKSIAKLNYMTNCSLFSSLKSNRSADGIMRLLFVKAFSFVCCWPDCLLLGYSDDCCCPCSWQLYQVQAKSHTSNVRFRVAQESEWERVKAHQAIDPSKWPQTSELIGKLQLPGLFMPGPFSGSFVR